MQRNARTSRLEVLRTSDYGDGVPNTCQPRGALYLEEGLGMSQVLVDGRIQEEIRILRGPK